MSVIVSNSDLLEANMEIKVIAKNIRISPQKTRLVIDCIRGKNALHAIEELRFIKRKAAKPVQKAIKSAIASAKNNYHLNDNNLYISKIIADAGPVYKRIKFRARGRRDTIFRRTTHITVVLAEGEGEKIKKLKKLIHPPSEEKVKEEIPEAKVEELGIRNKELVKKRKEKAVTTEAQKTHKEPKKEEIKSKEKIKEEKPKIIPTKKKKVFELKKEHKLKKKESFIKRFFRRKSV